MIKSTDVYLSLIYDSKVIHADESPVKVMRIDHAKIKNGKKIYMWVYRNRPLRGTHPIVLFDWQPSRHSDHPREFLNTFSGTVVTDGYQVYHKLARERRDLKVAGCWIHARRPFAEFIKSVEQDTARGSIAQEAYRMITEIMHIDNTFDDLSVTDRKKQRQLVLLEKVDAYFAWAKQKYSQVTHNSTIHKLLCMKESVNIIGIDNMNDYYDVSIKEWRLKEIETVVSEHPGSSWKFIKGNIADKELINQIFEEYKPAVVVNLAAQAGVRYSITNPDVYIESNLMGFYNILEACRHSYDNGQKGVEHLVYASSSSVYGTNKKIPYSTEDKVDNPVSLYAATKKSNELMAHAYSKLYN